MAENPYQAPQATVADYLESNPDGAILAEPRAVNVGQGAAWIRSAWEIFKASPGAWILMMVALLVLGFVASKWPYAKLLQNLAFPFVAAATGVMGDRLRRGEALDFGALVNQLAARAMPLLGVGLLYLAMVTIVAVVAFLPLVGMNGLRAFYGGAAPIKPDLSFVVAMLVFLALAVPAFMAVYFAPILVALHGYSPIAALQSSFRACLRNVLPFLLYGVLALLLSIAATIPVLLGWFIVGPLLLITVYSAYRDIYFES